MHRVKIQVYHDYEEYSSIKDQLIKLLEDDYTMEVEEEFIGKMHFIESE
jgi:hypothetical protein